MYKVVYLDRVDEDLEKIDKSAVRKILTRIETYLAVDPKRLGTPLKGEYHGYWRYRWGDYRIIYRIAQAEILILVARIGNRKDIYDK